MIQESLFAKVLANLRADGAAVLGNEECANEIDFFPVLAWQAKDGVQQSLFLDPSLVSMLL